MNSYLRYLLPLVLFTALLTGCLDSPTDTDERDFDDYDNTDDYLYLEENAQQDEVIVTESGLQYMVVEEGMGETAEFGDEVQAQFTTSIIVGMDEDGLILEVFDTSSSYIVTDLLVDDELLPGLAEGIQLMAENARYFFFLPPELTNDPDGPALVFQFHLHVIK